MCDIQRVTLFQTDSESAILFDEEVLYYNQLLKNDREEIYDTKG